MYIKGELPHTTDICKCSVCGLLFNSTSAFDKHRVGSHMPDERRCLSVTEMREKGMEINAKGRWVRALYIDYV